jgi:NADH-quinone oxidoreductase subunit K
MTVEQGAFILFSAITLGAALLVVTWRHVFHAALFLTLSFFGVVALYVLLEAPLLATIQFIYAIAVAVLIILTIVHTWGPAMVYTWGPASRRQPRVIRQWWAAVGVAALLCATLVWVILSHDWGGNYRAGATMVPLTWYLIVGAALFCVGLYGVLAQRNGIAILMGIELMLNAANVNLVAFWRYMEAGFALLVYAVAAAGTVVGLALIVALWRTHGTITPEDADLLKG